MSESENTIALTGRGFRTTLEASVVCEAIEKSTLLDDAKKAMLIGFARELGKQGAISVATFLAKVKESAPKDLDVLATVERIINSLFE